MTKQELNKMSTAERLKLFKQLVDSFDSVTVTGLYGAEAEVKSKAVHQGEAWGNNKKGNHLTISTDLCTG